MDNKQNINTNVDNIDIEEISKRLLKTVANIDGEVKGAFSLRRDGDSVERTSTKNITIRPREDGKPGIDVIVKPGTKNESVHIPVIVTKSGHNEMVYNDFHIGEGSDVTIVAGCAIHNCGKDKNEHDGMHVFHVGKDAKMRYSESHYGEGEGTGERVLNPTTKIYMEENSVCEMDMTQIKGVTSTVRDTVAHLGKGSKLNVTEKLLTHDDQTAVSNITIYLEGEDSSARIISRSVAQDSSKQEFKPVAIGSAECRGHIQCDSIIMDNASVRSIPAIEANHPEVAIVHEAAIGRINSDQLIKLETLGMSEEEAEQVIINAFLE